MRTLLMGALAATLVGCSSCPLSQQAGIQACMDSNEFACFDKAAGSQPIERKPASFKAEPAKVVVRRTIRAKTEQPSSAHARNSDQLATKTAKATMAPASVEPPAYGQPAGNASAGYNTTGSNVPSSPSNGDSAASSRTSTVREQVTAAVAAAEHATTATAIPASEQKANNNDHTGPSETARGDAGKTAPASPDNTDLLVALLMARPEIKSISDLANKDIAIDARQSASHSSIRTAIAAAGAAGVQLSEGQTKAIDRVISGQVAAAVLTLVSAEAAQSFPEIAGFKIFRIPLSPRSAVR